MKKYPFILFLLFSFLSASAQYYTNQNKVWFFGDSVGVDFNPGLPVHFTLDGGALEGSASVCNSAGNLLFYTNGMRVWNRLGAVMPGGTLVVPFSTASSTQGALIVPFVNDTNKYYLFSLEVVGWGGHLAYSIVDMTLAGGLGDIVPGSAGIMIDSGLGEKMIAIPGGDCNVWLMTHKIDTAKFYARNITTSGISPTPVISNVGSLLSYGGAVMKCSPDRRKIASVGLVSPPIVELYDFNPATGVVSNCQVLPLPMGSSCYGADFSPDNTKLYASGAGVFQWDISLPTTAAIDASRTMVSSMPWGSGDMRLGPDGKIYVSQWSIGTYLDRIDFPNAAGLGCNFVPNAVCIEPQNANSGLPNLVWSARNTVIPPAASSMCIGATTTLVAFTPGGTWSSSNPAVASISASGVVTAVATGTSVISYTTGTSCNGSAIITVVAGPTLTSASTCVASMSAVTASTGAGMWTSGSPSVVTIGSTTGAITGVSVGTAVITYNGSGCPPATTIVTVTPFASITGAALCSGTTITLSGPTPGGTWSSSNISTATIGSSTGVVTGIAAGSVMITFSTAGCSTTAMVTVDPVVPSSGSSLCTGATVTLTGSVPGGTWLSSNTAVATVGISSGVVTGISPGTSTISYLGYWSCPEVIHVTVNTAPGTISGKLSLCEGFSTILTCSPAGGTWLSSSPAATITSSGTLTGVAVGTAIITYTTPGGCYATAIVTVNSLPSPIAGPTTVAVGSSITLTDATAGGSWSSGDTTKGKVSSVGKVTGIGPGTVTIYYTLPTGCKQSVVINVVKSVGVTAISKTSKPSLYPNPATNEITIKAERSSFTSFTIYNAVGREFATLEIINQETTVNVKAFAPGEYRVVFKGEGTKEVLRFMKW